jgi:epoxyqueuosine reductase
MTKRPVSSSARIQAQPRPKELRPKKPSLGRDMWIEELIAGLVLDSLENRLDDFGGCPIFGRPLVGIADGEDSLFKTFRRVVGSRHLMPREVLERHSPQNDELKDIRVISWALPFTNEIRRSNRGRTWPSALYSVARNNGGALNCELSRRLTEAFQKRGIAAVSPLLLEEYDAFKDPRRVFSSTWSERHAAHAAGLGRFGLNGSIITPAGSHVRLGSIVVNYPFEKVRQNRKSHKSRCFETGGEDCGICMIKCPVKAITEQGLDKQKCYERRQSIRESHLEEYAQKYRLIPSPIAAGGRKYLGYSLGCALCQCSVPCEGTDPYLLRKE